MTIYDLLKNSSPSMARHFKESDEGMKDLKSRVTALEGGSGSSGEKNNVLIIKKEGVTGDMIRNGETVTFTTDYFNDGDTISITDDVEKHIMKDIDIIVLYSSSDYQKVFLKIKADFSALTANFINVEDVKNDGILIKNNTITRVLNESTDESGMYEPFTKVLTGQDGFELKNKIINNQTCTAYYMYISMDTTSNEKFPFTASFTPHCAKYVEQEGIKVYIDVPIMDFENEVYLNPDKLGIAITRQYNSEGKLGDIDLLVTKKLWDSLVSGSETMYEVYL